MLSAPSEESELEEARAGSLKSQYRNFLLGALLVVPALILVGFREKHRCISALLWCGIFLLGGALLGFLFGIASQTKKVDSEEGGPASFSNLEQISDWLTKIIIGVTLINAKEIPDKLFRLSNFLVGTAQDQQDDRTFILALIIYFSLAGFLIGYIATVLYARLLHTGSGAAALQALARKMEADLSKQITSALRGPTLVNYRGFLCLSVDNEYEALTKDGASIYFSPSVPSLELKIWLQTEIPQDRYLSFEEVSVTGGEEKTEVPFEIRVESELVDFERASQAFITPKNGRTGLFSFVGQFNDQVPKVSFGRLDAPETINPVWVMLFQHNRLIQSIALELIPR